MNQVYKTSIEEISVYAGLDLDDAYLTYDFDVQGEYIQADHSRQTGGF